MSSPRGEQRTLRHRSAVARGAARAPASPQPGRRVRGGHVGHCPCGLWPKCKVSLVHSSVTWGQYLNLSSLIYKEEIIIMLHKTVARIKYVNAYKTQSIE